jgi:hypothetical protein
MQLTPGQSFVLLILLGLAITGWLYGIHWKKVASGDGFTKEEKVIFQLQGQIEELTQRNAELSDALREYTGEVGETKDKIPLDAPISNAPLLQEQKVELPRR